MQSPSGSKTQWKILGKRPPVVLISIATVGRVIVRAISLECSHPGKKCKFMLRRLGEASDDRKRDEVKTCRDERIKQWLYGWNQSLRPLVPKARHNKLVIQELENEVLVYDLKRHQAHCLNRTAALIWEHCDGKQTVRGLARLLEQKFGVVTDEEVVWLGLHQLNKYHLLQEQMAPSAGYSAQNCSVTVQ